MNNIARLCFFLMYIALAGCSQQPPVLQDTPADALAAARRYCDYLEESLSELESLPTDNERRYYANGLRASLEYETALFGDQLRNESKRGALQKMAATAEYKAEIKRLGKLSQRFTRALERYVTH